MKWILAPIAALLVQGLLVQGLSAQVTLSAAVNAASYANPVLPNGSLTQGGVFIAFGSGMGPAKLQEISAYPLPTNLAGTSIAVTVNGTTVNCILLFTSANQVAAVLPSDTPAGSGTMVLSYNSAMSSALNVTVAPHNFGIFSVSQTGSGAGVITNAITNVVNSQTQSANATQLLDIWGTGLGPVAGNEIDGPLPGNIPNLPIQAFVGGQEVKVNYAGRSGCCTGLDQVEIVVPSGIVGCAVPVYVVVGGVTSNFVTVSIAQSGSTCVNPGALTASQLASAQANGGLRQGVASLLQDHSYIAKRDYESDTVAVSFMKTPYVDLTLVPPSPPPMANTCNITASGGSLPAGYESPTALAAGTVMLSGEVGPYTMLLQSTGGYGLVFEPSEQGAEAGIINSGVELTPGTYTFTGTAGTDIGAFNVSITLPALFNWTNRPSPKATISRSEPFVINWTNGYPGALVDIELQSAASLTEGVTVVCWADPTAGTFSVPVTVLQALPPTYSGGSASAHVSQGYMTNNFTAPGIDIGYASWSSGSGVTALIYK